MQTTISRVIEFFETHEWIQGSFSRDGGYCLLGAIRRVERDDAYDGRLKDEWLAQELGFDNSSQLIQWNDDEGRTKEDVIALLASRLEA